jgi:myo-inositol catabolism protein IolS
MKYRKLGSTGLDVSVIGVGTWQFGGEWGKDFSQREVDDILHKANELGINFIDTAECYGDHLSEKLIGGYLKNNKRNDWVVATKFGHHFLNDGFKRSDQWSADEVVKQLDNSLAALQTEYIDLYQFHSGSDEVFNNDALWTALDKQVQAGKVRHLGISISSKADTSLQVDSATKVGAEVIQVVYNRLDRKPEELFFPSAERQNLGVLARVPLASGYLSGKYKQGAVFAETDVRHGHDPKEVARQLQLVEEIQKHEVPEGVNMAQWALAWCLKHPAVTLVIPGSKNVEQVTLNAKAAELVE